MLGAAKTTGKPLAKLTTAQLTSVASTLQAKVAAGTATTKQATRAANAAALVAKRAPNVAPGGAPNPFVVAPFPTAAPPIGYQWSYDPSSNSYVPSPMSTATPPATTTYYPSAGGGGSGGAPDFSQFASGTDASGAPSTTTAPDFTGSATSTTTPAGMTTKTKIIIGVAAAGVLALVLLKRRKKA